METRAHYILIGAFMLLAIFMAVLFALWLGSVEREFDEYDVVFNERVSGLSDGAAVLFNGIDVGEVRDLKLDENNPERVIARVRVDQDTPIKLDTKAELELQGVTGLAVIQFSGGSPASPLMKEVSRRRPPQIQASLSPITRLLEGGGNIVASVQRLLTQENTDTVTRILADVETITDALARKDEEIVRTIENIATASDQLAAFADTLDERSAELESILQGADSFVNEDLQASLEEIDAVVSEARAFAEELRSTLGDNRGAIDAFAQQGLGEAAAAIAESRRLIRTMDQILREVERDPARFLFGDTRPQAQSN
ncbi:MlaD family protein [Aquisalinus flavus]|uniref:Mce/MlaD domain-containing protein n=1 Tax=Aquisalinus flavus TaxID=1526572 RepID=A0A8J2V4W8_9PROT|nr:MlaD family protein [Aquisalinus flavus]MBD0427507.1 MCE family protein [Aquisalinus flavus]UNE47302.1 MCE family protein [Aquisalinus flavus]GGD01529.1 hypothetical protein GCM10011342_08200 [Aquisalinus flavus]